jgi:hypothetical protein
VALLGVLALAGLIPRNSVILADQVDTERPQLDSIRQIDLPQTAIALLLT